MKAKKRFRRMLRLVTLLSRRRCGQGDECNDWRTATAALLPVVPKSWFSALMSHGNNDDQVLVHAVRDRVREARRQHMLARAMLACWIPQRCLGDTSERGINLMGKRNGCERTPLPVKRLALFEIEPGFGVELQPHSSATSSARMLHGSPALPPPPRPHKWHGLTQAVPQPLG